MAILQRGGPSRQSMHDHLQGAFYRLAQMQPRIQHLQSQSHSSFIDFSWMYFLWPATIAGQAHEEIKQNQQPVQQTHKDAVSNFMDEGRKAYDQACPATLALINTSPDLPPSTYRPFRWTCCASFSESVVLIGFNVCSTDLLPMTKAIIVTQPRCACRIWIAFWAYQEKPAKCSGACNNLKNWGSFILSQVYPHGQNEEIRSIYRVFVWNLPFTGRISAQADAHAGLSFNHHHDFHHRT